MANVVRLLSGPRCQDPAHRQPPVRGSRSELASDCGACQEVEELGLEPATLSLEGRIGQDDCRGEIASVTVSFSGGAPWHADPNRA